MTGTGDSDKPGGWMVRASALGLKSGEVKQFLRQHPGLIAINVLRRFHRTQQRR